MAAARKAAAAAAAPRPRVVFPALVSVFLVGLTAVRVAAPCFTGASTSSYRFTRPPHTVLRAQQQQRVEEGISRKQALMAATLVGAGFQLGPEAAFAEQNCPLFIIDKGADLEDASDDVCGQSEMPCQFTGFAKKADLRDSSGRVAILDDGRCADQGYSRKVSEETKKTPIGAVTITKYKFGYAK